ncbi:hypothetical protein [Streptomyces catenulae]|uniref:FeoB-associated Cys-rich membrane protein n=1 Tax=Streptomyces catenulae TaxID=66875 RepID=A0ABV2YXN0_9ACTN|nr:hypothetical protein [Streptomyces catenulae]
MTVDPVLALIALLAAVAVVLLARHAGRRSPGPLCARRPATVRDACSTRCPACTALKKESHR